MEDSVLVKKVIAYGADPDGIRDRFCGNDALFARCFRGLLTEPNWAMLHCALSEEPDYAKAFAAAHALKGLSGNIGVTALYAALCTLVEMLRAKDSGNLAAAYAEVRRQHGQLVSAFSDRPADAAEVPDRGAGTG